MASITLNDIRDTTLLGFTGIDYRGALMLLYEIGDITFSNSKKLVSWIGVITFTASIRKSCMDRLLYQKASAT
jgi:hypothetical protein